MRVGFVGAVALPLLSCNPVAYVRPLSIHTVESSFVAQGSAGQFVIELNSLFLSGSAGKRVGFELTANGKSAAQGVCELVSKGDAPGSIGFFPKVACPVPVLPAGDYALRATGDANCANSMHDTGFDIEVIKPAHIMSISPTSLPDVGDPNGNVKRNVTVTGSNIAADGIPYVYCEFTWFAGPGAKLDGSGSPLGCATGATSMPVIQNVVGADHGIIGAEGLMSVICPTPGWPGPLQVCGDGCKPVEGAVCAMHVRIQLSNDAKVFSPEEIYLQYGSTLIA